MHWHVDLHSHIHAFIHTKRHFSNSSFTVEVVWPIQLNSFVRWTSEQVPCVWLYTIQSALHCHFTRDSFQQGDISNKNSGYCSHYDYCSHVRILTSMHPFVTPAPRAHKADNNNQGAHYHRRPNCHGQHLSPWTQLEHHLQKHVVIMFSFVIIYRHFSTAQNTQCWKVESLGMRWKESSWPISRC